MFLLVASMRKSGMDEPVIVGAKGLAPEDEAVLKQFGDVSIYSLDSTKRNLTCHKPEVMLRADTDYITWTDGDAFFTGNCSELLPPEEPGAIHIRQRAPEENIMAFVGHNFGEDGKSFPKAILEQWQKDVNGNDKPAYLQACSACFLSVHRNSRIFLEKWHKQIQFILPKRNVGVTDKKLTYYHQLDESVLNSLLYFYPHAPKVSGTFKLNKDYKHCYIHFAGSPKPWMSWIPSSITHFDQYVDVVEYVVAQRYKLPSRVPFSLKRKNKFLCQLLARPMQIRAKILNQLKKLSK